MKEVWKEIKGFSNYQVSNLGRLKNTKFKNHYNKGTITNCGYVQVGLSKNKKQHMLTLHRLVAEHFIPNPENKPQVNHKDGNKCNNNVSNLEWVTGSENTKHAIKNGLMKKPKGGKRPAKKVEVYKNNKLIDTFNSLGLACRTLNLHLSHAAANARGETKQHKGYILKYIK